MKNSIRITTALLLLLSASINAQQESRFKADDPLWHDPDQNPSPVPAEQRIPQLFDFLETTFRLRPKEGVPIPAAENANTLGEVPDSSWFVNRIGRRTPDLDELARGPNLHGGPNPGRWTIIAAKAQGITPGFTVRDAAGNVFFVKFDPPENPGLATSTEAIVTNFFHAFGYNVPENYLAYLTRDNLDISPDARLTDEEGKKRSFEKEDLDRIFSRIFRSKDGRTPVVASLRLEGRPIGPFSYFGTRPDDMNDIFPHQNRRELRGLRVFCAWLNHDDSRSINTLDIYSGPPDKGHVRHYLIDFGSCLGSGSVKVQTLRAGNEYIIEPGPILKSALSLGLWDRPWRRIHYPDFPSVGRFEGEFFRPELWRPEYPNPAFDRMLPDDAFWAVRIVAKFTDEMIRALVKTGQLPDPKAEEYLATTLIQRRDRILRHYLPLSAAFDGFEVLSTPDGSTLRFQDLLANLRIESPSPLSYRWSDFDNTSHFIAEPKASGTSHESSLKIPEFTTGYQMVEIRREGSGLAARVYLREQPAQVEVVGIERDSRLP